jgi:hypothetical protein
MVSVVFKKINYVPEMMISCNTVRHSTNLGITLQPTSLGRRLKQREKIPYHSSSSSTHPMIDFVAAFLNFAAFVLSLFSLLGDISNVGFFRDIYYSRVDLIQSSNSILNTLTGDVGIPDYLTFGAFSICEGSQTQGITYCTPAKLGANYGTFA